MSSPLVVEGKPGMVTLVPIGPFGAAGDHRNGWPPPQQYEPAVVPTIWPWLLIALTESSELPWLPMPVTCVRFPALLFAIRGVHTNAAVPLYPTTWPKLLIGLTDPAVPPANSADAELFGGVRPMGARSAGIVFGENAVTVMEL